MRFGKGNWDQKVSVGSHALSIERRGSEMEPLANAPPGWVWRWNTKRIGHLVETRPYKSRYLSGMWSMCGKRVSGNIRSFQIGGFSTKPCRDCLAKGLPTIEEMSGLIDNWGVTNG